ncbi:DUF5994 family protein [Saccharothrix sp. ST-888]|uniref:DUF5994 family protein n=1 Tax=Saccharothrix sp. ST-888 TaxID=1427391 RepID=UPI0022B19B9C|nr:DUF5994 family protein [Saccharothrix sp. ST-888]
MPIPLPSSPSGPWVAPGLPLLPRLTLEPSMARTGMFDGAWWPRSRDVRSELPDLITALSAHVGRIIRVGLSTLAWADVPRSVTADRQVVKVSRIAGSDGTISLTRGLRDHFLLLVVPPGTDPRTAAAAMAAAASTGNYTTAADLLAAVDRPTPDGPSAS